MRKNKKEKSGQEVKKLKDKLTKCITEKFIARGSNILLKGKKKNEK